jgi:hypothetical protein
MVKLRQIVILASNTLSHMCIHIVHAWCSSWRCLHVVHVYVCLAVVAIKRKGRRFSREAA